MNPNAANAITIILGAIGTIFILAGVFLGMGYGLFAGITCYIFAGVVKKMAGLER